MSDVSESSTDISQCSTDDSGINNTLESSSAESNEKNEQEATLSSCSDVLTELLLNHKKLKELETQMRSLSLILEHGKLDDSNAGINHAVFQENKNFLEEEIKKIKKEISDKELFLQTRDFKSFQYYTESINNIANNKTTGLDDVFQTEDNMIEQVRDEIHLNGEESLQIDVELSTSTNHNDSIYKWQYFESSDKDENAKLRRALTETRQKQKEERDEIMKQLKALQITTVNGETNWRCVLREKQLKIDELTKKNTELQTKYAELDACFKNCGKLKQKEAKEYERKKRKYEKLISSFKTQNPSFNENITNLESEVKVLRSFKQDVTATMGILRERNKVLEEDLFQKRKTLDEKTKILEESSKEIKETNSLMNKLVMEINCLSKDKENLNRQLEAVTNTLQEEQLKSECSGNVSDSNDESKCCIDVALQTPDSECQLKIELLRIKADLEVKQGENKHLVEELHKQHVRLDCLKENETELQKDIETWRTKSVQNERTIQELTISLGKATIANDFSSEKNVEENEDTKTKEFPHCILEMLREIKVELRGAQEDFIKHKKSVESLQKTWGKYNNSVMEFNEDLRKLYSTAS